jgi:hypothetical protein
MNVFQAIGQTLNSFVAVLTAAARTTEKGVQLVENEVDLLKEEQNIRICTARAQLASLPHHQSQVQS